MSQLLDKDLFEVNISVIRKTLGAIPFDVYLKRAENTYTKLFSQNDPIDHSRLAGYESSKGIHFLYVQRKDFTKYERHVESVVQGVIAKPETTNYIDMAEVTREMINLAFTDLLLKKNVDEKVLRQSTLGVRSCLTALESDPKSMAYLLKIIYQKYPYEVKRAISTAIFGILLARKAKIVTDKSLMMIGLGGILHDVGMTKLKVNPELKSDLSPEEWDEVKEHPQIGKKMLDGVAGVSTEVKMIVLQHHEQPNGLGYPNRLHDQDIFVPAKIVAIADCFTALNCKRPMREAFSPERSFQILFEDVGKFDQKLLTSFAELFRQNHLLEDSES